VDGWLTPATKLDRFLHSWFALRMEKSWFMLISVTMYMWNDVYPTGGHNGLPVI